MLPGGQRTETGSYCDAPWLTLRGPKPPPPAHHPASLAKTQQHSLSVPTALTQAAFVGFVCLASQVNFLCFREHGNDTSHLLRCSDATCSNSRLQALSAETVSGPFQNARRLTRVLY